MLSGNKSAGKSLHKIALEELSEIPLSSCIREVADVQPASFGNDGNYSFVLSCVDWFTTSEVVGPSIRVIDVLLNTGRGQSVGDVFDCRHSYYQITSKCWNKKVCRMCLSSVLELQRDKVE